MEAAMLDTYSAPRILTAAKATPKSRVERTTYTPKAYQPYVLMSAFSRPDSVCFSAGPGEDWRDGGRDEEGVERSRIRDDVNGRKNE